MHVTCTEGVAAAATRELFRVEKDAKRRSTATTLDLSESEYSEITAMDHSDNSGSEEGESIDELIAQITREVSETFMKECQDASKSPSEINVEDVAQLVAASLLKRQQEKAKRKPGKTYATIEEYDRDFWDGELRELEGESRFFKMSDRDSKSSCSSSSSELDDASSIVSDVSSLSGVSNALASARSAPQVTEGPLSSGETPTIPLKRASVKFTTLRVREYDIILGDNPACTSGPPISIGWDYTEHPPLKVDSFESIRQRRTNLKRDLLLSREKREKILKRLGVSEAEIADAVRRNNKLRSQRRQTLNNMASDAVVEKIQNATKSFTGFVLMKKR